MSFEYKGWTLEKAIDALMAYDLGATDSGVKDDAMKKAVIDHLRSLDDADFRRVVSVYVREHYLTDQMIQAGYGIESVREFINWMADEGIDL